MNEPRLFQTVAHGSFFFLLYCFGVGDPCSSVSVRPRKASSSFSEKREFNDERKIDIKVNGRRRFFVFFLLIKLNSTAFKNERQKE